MTGVEDFLIKCLITVVGLFVLWGLARLTEVRGVSSRYCLAWFCTFSDYCLLFRSESLLVFSLLRRGVIRL